MAKYKVFGARQLNFWTDVEAKDGAEAYDRAFELDTIAWNQIEDDNEIEPVDVYEMELEEVNDTVYIDDEEEFVFDPVNVIGDKDEA